MSLGFFADHCVPSSMIDGLRRDGHAVTRLRDVMAIRSPDQDVIAKACELDLVLLSLNGDFGDIVRYPPATHRGVVAIQLHNRPQVIPQLMERLRRFLATHPDQVEYAGKLLIVETHRIRIRR